MDDDTLGVYCAGETLEGSSISITYVELRDNGRCIRMTNEEARATGSALIRAAAFNEDQARDD